MPFITPALPALGKLGATMGLGFLGKKLSSPSPEQSQQANQLNLLSNEALTRARSSDQLADESRRTGMSFLSRFTNQLQQPVNYFQQLLSGNPTSTLSALGPQLGQMRGAQQSLLSQATNLSPRGGGRSSMLFDLPMSNAAQTSSMFGQSRMGAASTLPQLAAMSGDMGSNFLRLGESQSSRGANLLGTAMEGTGLGMRQANANQQQSYQQGQAFANMFAPFLDKIDWTKLFKLGGGGGGGVSGINPFSFVTGMA